MRVNFYLIRPSLAYNARPDSNADTKELQALADSIAMCGLIVPLTVKACVEQPADDSSYEIVDGHRRYAAIAKLIEEGRWNKEIGVPVHVVHPTEEGHLTLSIVANVQRLPMHPVDQYTAMQRLVDLGMSQKDMAATFGISSIQVKRVLALGSLHRLVLEAWKKGWIEEDTARAFTIGTPEQQEQVAKMIGENGMAPWQVRQHLVPDQSSANLIGKGKIVSEKEYRDRGGVITKDLFTTEVYISDAGLAQQIATEKVNAAAEEWRANGWPNVEIDMRETYKLVDLFVPTEEEEEAEGFDETAWLNSKLAEVNDEQKQQIIVNLHLARYSGTLETKFFAKPAETEADDTDQHIDAAYDDDDADAAAAAPATTTGPTEQDGLKISVALKQDMLEWRCNGHRLAFSRDPLSAMRLFFCYGELTIYMDQPHGHSTVPQSLIDDTLALKESELMVVIGQKVAMWLNTKAATQTALERIMQFIDAGAMRGALEETFDYESYFARMAKQASIQLLRQVKAAKGETGVEFYADEKKEALAKRAAMVAKNNGWLPALILEGVPPVSTETVEEKKPRRKKAA